MCERENIEEKYEKKKKLREGKKGRERERERERENGNERKFESESDVTGEVFLGGFFPVARERESVLEKDDWNCHYGCFDN